MARVFVGMSGGVDSSTAAVLLRESGHEVSGLHLQLLRGLPLESGAEDGSAAARAAETLGLPFHELDLSETFRQSVVAYFIREYEAGRTPNPCVVCNRRIKFGEMWERARALGAEYLATGHYARIEYDEKSGRWLLLRGADPDKDQSYFLSQLTQEQLSRTLFPLGMLRKTQVREIAAAHGLEAATRRDSQDICFVPDGDYARLIERLTGRASPEGDFLDEAGNALGRHRGFIRYTRGQHRGLALPIEPPLYVLDKDAQTHAIRLGTEDALYADTLTVRDANWIAVPALTEPMRVSVKTRHSRREADAELLPLADGRVRVRFSEPQRALTPGQFAVFYDGERVVGGGAIEE